MWRSVRWLDRCIAQHEHSGRTSQNLFAIIQGGLDSKLRDICLEEMVMRKASVAGYAIGGAYDFSFTVLCPLTDSPNLGLSGGEAKGKGFMLRTQWPLGSLQA